MKRLAHAAVGRAWPPSASATAAGAWSARRTRDVGPVLEQLAGGDGVGDQRARVRAEAGEQRQLVAAHEHVDRVDLDEADRRRTRAAGARRVIRPVGRGRAKPWAARAMRRAASAESVGHGRHGDDRDRDRGDTSAPASHRRVEVERGVHPAVGGDRLPGDRPRGVGRQEGHDVGDLVGLGEPAGRDRRRAPSSVTPGLARFSRHISVCTTPGATALARMPRGPYSIASALRHPVDRRLARGVHGRGGACRARR